jgi:NAD-dependent SIR2 family protein deacetylase
MPSSFTCLHCGKNLPVNHRLKKKQKYCSAKSCQQARRSDRKKERYKSDSRYRKKHLDTQKVWREKRPAHQYQREYRQNHPQYVKRNRELQKTRNKNHQKEPATMIVNGTSLFTQPNGGEAYAIFKINNEKIVNGTSFIARMQVLSKKDSILMQSCV